MEIKVGVIAGTIGEREDVRTGAIAAFRFNHLQVAHQGLRRLVLEDGGMGKLNVGKRIVYGEAPFEAATTVIGRPHPDSVSLLGIEIRQGRWRRTGGQIAYFAGTKNVAVDANVVQFARKVLGRTIRIKRSSY